MTGDEPRAATLVTRSRLSVSVRRWKPSPGFRQRGRRAILVVMAARRRTRKQWSELVAKFGESGAAMSRFCARHRVSVQTFKWWRWHLREEAQAATAQDNGVRLIAVDVQQPLAVPASSGAVRIGIADLDVRVEVGTDIGYVAALVDALRARC